MDFLSQVAQGYKKTFFTLISTQILQTAFGFLFSFFTTRLINPEDLGRWSSSIFFFNIYSIFTDMGIEAGVFESDSDSNDEKMIAAFTFRNILSFAPLLVSAFLYQQGSVDIFFLCYALFYWLDKTSNISKINLDINFRQKKASLVELVSFVFSSLVGVLSVFLNMPIMLIPAQKISEKFFILIFSFQRNFLHIRTALKNMNRVGSIIKKFGFATLLSNIAGIFIYDFSPFFLSILLDSKSAGIYTKAFALATFPLLITSVFNRVTTPIYGKFSKDTQICRRVFLYSQIIKFIILAPLFAGLTITSKYWLTLLGPQWQSALVVYKILNLYGFARCFYDDLGPLFNLAIGKPKSFAKIQLLYGLIIFTSSPLIFFYVNDLVTFAIINSCIMVFITLVSWAKAFKNLGLERSDFQEISNALSIKK